VRLLIRNSRSGRLFRPKSAPAWHLLALFLCAVAVRSAFAQRPAASPQPRALIAASEDRLWTARVERDRTFLSYRDRTGQPVLAEPLNARSVQLIAAGQQAYTFQEDGSFYRYSDEWAPALYLPQRQVPFDATAVDGVPHALIETQAAAELPAYDAAANRPATRTFTTTAAPLTLVRYDQLGWSAVAPCPAEVAAERTPELGPRLCATPGGLMLFSSAPGLDGLNCWTFEPLTAQWVSGPRLSGAAGLKGFWPTLVNHLPTLVLHVADADGNGELRFFRLMGAGTEYSWEPASLELSPLPPSTTGTPTPVDACGFNQHLGVQVSLPDGSAYLRFGRFEGRPTLGTIDLLAKPPQNVLPALLQALRAAVLLAILVALFVLRRGSLVAPFPLGTGQAPAYVLQRLAATLVDLLPFTFVAALVMGLNWSSAMREAVNLLSDSGAQEGPSAPVMFWMLLSAGSYAAYCLIMELLTGRTAGKLLFGLQVVAEQGRRASVGRIVVRNLFRVIEVLPVFWILAFVMLLSRNRQRVGDIFARTIVVRQVAIQANSAD